MQSYLCKILFLFFLLCIAAPVRAQQQSCAEQSSWILETTLVPAPNIRFRLHQVPTPLLRPAQVPQPAKALTPVFLPRWSAEALPFFCKIEHQWGKKMAIPFKFRLGSVEYVDWLEGK